MKIINYPCVLTIAGSDPSGGAGIQADIKAISATGGYAASVITALTAQNTKGVLSVQEISPDFVAAQLNAIFEDLTPGAIKIGMLHNQEIIAVVADYLARYKPPHIVLDPVMVAKNGCPLLQADTIDFMKQHLLPLVSLITPNLPEAEKLLAQEITSPFAMASAAKKIGDEFGINVLIKGGHLGTDQSSDVLYENANSTHHWFHTKRIFSKNTHGTGCTLSSAIATCLACGFSLQAAILVSKNYLSSAIQAGSTLEIGHGHGPVHHFYFLENNHHDIFSHA